MVSVITIILKIFSYINAMNFSIKKLDNGHIQVCFEIDPSDLIKDK
jgi:hypothetical protein